MRPARGSTVRWHRAAWFPMWYGFCPDRESWRAELARSLRPYSTYPEYSGCCVAYDLQATGERCVLVTLSDDALSGDQVVMLGLLVHECSHVVDWLVKAMEDDAPSDEFRAYSLQAVFSELMNDVSGHPLVKRALQSESKKLAS